MGLMEIAERQVTFLKTTSFKLLLTSVMQNPVLVIVGAPSSGVPSDYLSLNL